MALRKIKRGSNYSDRVAASLFAWILKISKSLLNESDNFFRELHFKELKGLLRLASLVLFNAGLAGTLVDFPLTAISPLRSGHVSNITPSSSVPHLKHTTLSKLTIAVPKGIDKVVEKRKFLTELLTTRYPAILTEESFSEHEIVPKLRMKYLPFRETEIYYYLDDINGPNSSESFPMPF
ncbi:hypothetical protein J6590_007883 [Homalodisca vitripennis]|nr:hypothetical protein J6590_007883 [Homalodisca vitripennis]